LHRKNLDAIVANPIDQLNSGFGSDNNQAIFLDKQGQKIEIPPCSKLQMAHHIFDFLGK
jgi:phosphopantothenoylcysteine decarboxylase/phosphopantothenate--cysteine ligase